MCKAVEVVSVAPGLVGRLLGHLLSKQCCSQGPETPSPSQAGLHLLCAPVTSVRREGPSPLTLTLEGLLDGQPCLNSPLQGLPTTQPASGPGGVTCLSGAESISPVWARSRAAACGQEHLSGLCWDSRS